MRNVVRNLAKIGRNLDLAGKTVIDYGVGSGHLGLALIRDVGIRLYVAIDISRASLNTTRTTLHRAGLARSRFETHLIPMEFSDVHADCFFSLAVIQHFPDHKFLRDFFRLLNRSGIPLIYLQTRATSSPEIPETHDPVNAGMATRISLARVQQYLPHYCVVEYSSPDKVTYYQFIILRRRILENSMCGTPPEPSITNS